MATQKTQIITFNNLLLSGDQALMELTNSVSADAGLPPTAANVVKDATGKLVRVELNLPDATSQSAIDAIANHAGVASVSSCFPQLALNDLDPGVGLTTGNGFPALLPNQFINANGAGGQLGFLEDTGYTDFAPLAGAVKVEFFIRNKNVTDLVIPTGATITLTFSGGLTKVFTFVKSLTMQSDGVLPATFIFYADTQGNLIVKLGQFISGVAFDFPSLPYEDACQDPNRNYSIA